MEKFKAYNFGFILYYDSEIYDIKKILEYIEQNYSLYAYITHKPEKEETKTHVHVIVKFPNKRYNSSISKELGVPENYFQKINLNSYLRYLIHYDDEDKIQYSVDEVKGPLKEKLISLLKSPLSDKENLEEIMNIISQINKKISYKFIFVYCLENNLISTYLRYYNIIRDIINEHNNYFID